MNDDTKAAFFIGLAIAFCLVCLYQDFLGQEKYLEVVKNKWTTMPWGLWLFPLSYLSIALYGILRS